MAFGPSAERRSEPASVTIGEVRGVSVAISRATSTWPWSIGSATSSSRSRACRPPLVVDLTAVSYLDSAGVHLLFKLARRRQGRRRHSHRARRAVRRVLELTGVEATLGLDQRRRGWPL